MMREVKLNMPLRIIAAVLAVLAIAGIVGDALTIPSIGVMQVLWWGATLLGVWVLAKAAWRGVLVFAHGKAR